MAVPGGWPPARFGGLQNPAYRLPRPPPDLRIHGVTSMRVSDLWPDSRAWLWRLPTACIRACLPAAVCSAITSMRARSVASLYVAE